MSEHALNRISELEAEKASIMCRYSCMKACQQDRADERMEQIDLELNELKAS